MAKMHGIPVSFLIFLVVLALSENIYGKSYQYGSIDCKKRSCTYRPHQIDTKATAFASFNDTLFETGWGILDVVGGYGGTDSDDDIMYAAGFLEGIFTNRGIYNHYMNLKDFFLKSSTPTVEQKLRDFFNSQDAYMRSMISQHAASDPLWRHVGLILAQYDGLVAGYKHHAPPDQQLDIFAFQVLNGAGDLLDLVKAINPSSIPDFKKMTKSQIQSYMLQNSHCSALIKVLPAYEDIFMSHSSWFIYAATNRIYKHYNFNVSEPTTAAKKISFSSYPGFLESLDDFYLLGSQMVMLQTTNNIFNKDLYKSVTPNALLAWQRVRTANMMAHDGGEWASVMAKYNSGTYNNQYMVIDLKKIELNKDLHDGALWLIEQIPTFVEYADATALLREGYFPSYNVPFFEKIYNMSGYPDMVAKYGVDMSYQLAPRAKIFRRDNGKVVDMDSMKKIMRYNDYTHDPYSEKDACNTICCRGDLRSEPAPIGCYDTKVADYKMALNFQADIINGPTLGTQLPPFAWTAQFNQSHMGLPDKYNFAFMTTAPRWNKT